MELLQQQVQQSLMTKDAMFIAAISALVTVIVWLALYIRKLHNKMIEYMQEDKKESVEVISKNTSAAEQAARSNERLADVVEELNKTILTQNRRRD